MLKTSCYLVLDACELINIYIYRGRGNCSKWNTYILILRTYIYIYIYTHTHTHTYAYLYIYIYIYIYKEHLPTPTPSTGKIINRRTNTTTTDITTRSLISEQQPEKNSPCHILDPIIIRDKNQVRYMIRITAKIVIHLGSQMHATTL